MINDHVTVYVLYRAAPVSIITQCIPAYTELIVNQYAL